MPGAELLDDFDDCASLNSFQSCTSRTRRQRAVVKNTFVDIIDSDDEFRKSGGGGHGLRRSFSDSDLSSVGDDGGGDVLGYWLAPSLSSQSSVGSSRRDEFHWIGDRPYYGTRGNAGLDMIEVDVKSKPKFDTGHADQGSPGLTERNVLKHERGNAGLDMIKVDVSSKLKFHTGRADPGSRGLTERNVLKHERAAPLDDPPEDPLEPAVQGPVLPVGEGAAFIQSIYDELEGQMPMEKLQELYDEDQLRLIPRDENGALTSLGAIKHECGDCFSCAYWFKGLCKYGIACNYCHMVHPGQRGKRLRPSRQTRMRMKKHEARKAAEVSVGGDSAGTGNVLLDDDDCDEDDCIDAPGAAIARPVVEIPLQEEVIQDGQNILL